MLLVGAAAAAMIETGASNLFVLLALFVALAGDSFFDGPMPFWARWISAGVALVFAVERIFWLPVQVLRAMFRAGGGRVTQAMGGAVLLLPALVLALVFGALLASGNAVFAHWTSHFFTWLATTFSELFNGERLFLWALVAAVALPLLRPSNVRAFWWTWLAELPRWPLLVPVSGGILFVGSILGVMNLLFFVANLADAIFLWSGAKLPSGVTYSDFVHNGVNTLSFTVVLSALVLAMLFQLDLQVAGRRGLKALGLFWIAQNLFLVASVLLRLLRYIDAYGLTVARVDVILFLLLVTAGYLFLVIKIVREKSLPWLLGRSALAVFVLFYGTQFLNTDGWIADYNVARWERDPARDFDVNYLRTLGPAAWPAYRRYFDDRHEPAVWPVQTREWTCDPAMFVTFDAEHWREFSLRAFWNRGLVEAGG